MSLENVQSREDHLLENRNMIQIMLAQKHGQDIGAFIGEHAKDVSDYIDSHPDILNKFDNDPDGVLDELDKVVYH